MTNQGKRNLDEEIGGKTDFYQSNRSPLTSNL